LGIAQRYRPTAILIEEMGVGSALAAELVNARLPVVRVQVEHNKLARMSVQSGKFANGQIVLPRQALWLNNYEEEMFSFPASEYDDQVDSTSQALAYNISARGWSDKSFQGHSRLVEGLVMDHYLGLVTGRPW
jgi:predicted phage terminase large subunit-like protein